MHVGVLAHMQYITAFHIFLLLSKKAVQAQTRLCHKTLGGEDHQRSKRPFGGPVYWSFFHCLPNLPQLVGITGLNRLATSPSLMSVEWDTVKDKYENIDPKWFDVEVSTEVDFVITWLPGEWLSCLCEAVMNAWTPAD